MDPEPTTAHTDATAAPHRALYRRWRAQTFSRIVGQEAVVATLRNAVRSGRVAHALLFVGPRGTGKTSLARIVAKALNCTDIRDGDPCDACPSCVAIREGRALDVVELDAATNNKVDDMRVLLERTWTAPSDLRRKVYIIDEVQRIKEGWDVLLKTLEEPPDHVVFIFCTTDPSQVRPAVLSRVQRFDFRPLTIPEIEGKLTTILAADDRPAEPEAVRLIARQAAGGMRDAESMLDQLLANGAERLTVGDVRDLLGLVDGETVEAFVDAFARRQVLAGIAILDSLDASGRDLGAFMGQVVGALREALGARLAGTVGAGRPDWTLEALADAGRRLGAIDPGRLGAGGLRFQLELALLAGGTAEGSWSVLSAAPAPTSPTRPLAPSARATSSAPPVPVPMVQVAPTPSAPASEAARPRRRSGPVEASNDRADAAAAPAAAPPGPGDRATPTTPPAEAPAADAQALSGAEPDGLGALARIWPEIVADLSRSPAIKPLIAVCRPIAVDGNVVTLGFPEGMAFLKDVAERRRSNLEDGIGRAVGRAVAVRCVATNLDLVALPVDDDAERIAAAARRIFADDLVDAAEVD